MIEEGLFEVDLLGKGGFGETYLVQDKRLRFGKQLIAVKVPDINANTKSLRNEINTLVNLGRNHKNLISFLGLVNFRTEFDIALEYVNGEDLSKKIKSLSNDIFAGKDSIFLKIENIIYQILNGVKYIHDNNMIHRDIKPSNILCEEDAISGDLLIKITDFGLTRRFSLNETVTRCGTPCYMAPECFKGKASFTSDIYSFGVILYEILTGQLPINFKECISLEDYIEEAYKQIPLLPSEILNREIGLLEKIVMKCLEKEPNNRYQSIDDILKELSYNQLNKVLTNELNSPMSEKDINLKKVVDTFIEACRKEGLVLLNKKDIEHGVQIAISNSLQKNVVNIYFGRKGISIVVGGKRSALFDILSNIKNRFLRELTEKENKSQLMNIVLPPPPWIGTDESGKGDYFGPLVIAGIYVEKNEQDLFKNIGVKDSKLLSDERILKIADYITKIIKKENYSIIEIPPESYNKLYIQFINEGKNLNTLLAWGHARAIEDIIKKGKQAIVISDQFGDEKYIKSKLLKETRVQNVNIIQIHKAEQNIAVAAASILARARFLNWFKMTEKEWGIKFLKGSSTAVEEIAKLFVAKFGRENLEKVAKVHFKTTKRIIKYE
ncbi:MAG: ribonuclease HIII [Elusimicrobiota bacterium]